MHRLLRPAYDRHQVLQQLRAVSLSRETDPAHRARIPSELRRIAHTAKARDLVTHVHDRLGHDRCYAIDYGKAASELGYAPGRQRQEGLASSIDWNWSHTDGWRALLGRATVPGFGPIMNPSSGIKKFVKKGSGNPQVRGVSAALVYNRAARIFGITLRVAVEDEIRF